MVFEHWGDSDVYAVMYVTESWALGHWDDRGLTSCYREWWF